MALHPRGMSSHCLVQQLCHSLSFPICKRGCWLLLCLSVGRMNGLYTKCRGSSAWHSIKHTLGVADTVAAERDKRHLEMQDSQVYSAPVQAQRSRLQSMSTRSLYWVAFILFYFIYLYFFALSRAAPMAYGGSQARGSNRSCSRRPTPEPQQRRI